MSYHRSRFCPAQFAARARAHLHTEKSWRGLDICGATLLFGGGAVLVWTWCVIERRSGVKDERDVRLVLCLWPTACSCGRHCGHAHLHTFGRSSGRQCRPRGVASFKTEAKGRASRQPFYADTYPYIIWTAVHISRERKRLVSPVSTCKYKQCSAGLSCISVGDKARSSLMS